MSPRNGHSLNKRARVYWSLLLVLLLIVFFIRFGYNYSMWLYFSRRNWFSLRVILQTNVELSFSTIVFVYDRHSGKHNQPALIYIIEAAFISKHIPSYLSALIPLSGSIFHIICCISCCFVAHPLHIQIVHSLVAVIQLQTPSDHPAELNNIIQQRMCVTVRRV